jgi:hypothetical protein
MTWTWADIIRLALVRSGLVGVGQVATAAQLVEGEAALNLLLDEWDGDGMALPSFSTNITFDTVAGVAKYTLGPAGDVSTRPETIVTGTCTIAGGGLITKITMAPMSYPAYTMIPVPQTQSQPWNYAINETWPQMEFFLYPTPNAVYPIILNCKVKWAATVGDPDLNPFVIAQVPSGYATALVDNLALKMAENYRLETKTLETKAKSARNMIALAVGGQNAAAAALQELPIGIFSWNIITAGKNP